MEARFVDTDKLVSIKGLVIRATPVIPDMKLGRSPIQKHRTQPCVLIA
jgi:DNA replicative helicase MCM subunit Mcm2 (Cdc46/Mcm family)